MPRLFSSERRSTSTVNSQKNLIIDSNILWSCCGLHQRLNCSTLNQNHVQQMPPTIKTQSSLCSLFSFRYRFSVTMANKSKQDAINKLTPLFFSSSSSLVGLHGQTDLCPYSCISCRLWGCMLSLTLDELETIIPVEYCNFTTMPSVSRANYRSTMSVSITPWVLQCSHMTVSTANKTGWPLPTWGDALWYVACLCQILMNLWFYFIFSHFFWWHRARLVGFWFNWRVFTLSLN